MSGKTASKRLSKKGKARARPVCPICGPGTKIFPFIDGLGRVIRTRPRVYCCDRCASAFAAR